MTERRFEKGIGQILSDGEHATVYRGTDDTVIKVYKYRNSSGDARLEKQLAAKAEALGIPTAKPLGVCRLEDGRTGVMFELVDAETMARHIANHPECFEEDMAAYFSLLDRIHAIMVSPEELPDVRDFIGQCILAAKDCISRQAYAELVRLEKGIPARCQVIHCDYHVKNVLLHDGEPILIDMETMCRGNSVYDLVSMYTSYVLFTEKTENSAMDYFGFSRETALRIMERAWKQYNTSDREKKTVRVLALARMIRHCRLRGLETKAYAAELERECKEENGT